MYVRKTDCCHVNILTVSKFCLLSLHVGLVKDVLYCAMNWL